jgi:hypothetical protein
MQIKEAKRIVEHILNTVPETRDSDSLLIIEVLKFIDPSIIDQPFKMVIPQCSTEGRFPSLETIRRTRQKIQADNPMLGPSKEVEGLRGFQEHKFFEFSISRRG